MPAEILRVLRDAKSGDQVVVEVCRMHGHRFLVMAGALIGR
jgi:hypothetical protein